MGDFYETEQLVSREFAALKFAGVVAGLEFLNGISFTRQLLRQLHVAFA